MRRSEISSFLEEVGLTPVEIDRRKHWRVRARRLDGSEVIVSLPTSESDHRALKNKRSQLRAIAQGA